MRVWRIVLLALVLAQGAAAQVAEIPEAHLLLVDRGALKPSDPARDGARFEAAEKPIYHQLLANHGANLILDARAAPAHWSGLDVTGEAVAALHAAVPEWSPQSSPAAPAAPAVASSVRMLFADIATFDPFDARFHETLEHVAAGKGATLVVDKRAVVMGAPDFDVTELVHSSFETYRDSGTLPLVVGGPDVPMARVAILDRIALVRDSAAGRDIASQLRALTDKEKAALQPEVAAFKQERAALQQQTAQLAPKDASKAMQDYNARWNAFTAKVEERQAAINAAAGVAHRKLEAAAGPVVLQILKDDHANMMLDRTAIVASDDALDITTPVLAKLDAALPHVDVTLAPAQKK